MKTDQQQEARRLRAHGWSIGEIERHLGVSRSSASVCANMLPWGTCALIVDSTEIAQTIYGSIQEMGGFTRSEWLD